MGYLLEPAGYVGDGTVAGRLFGLGPYPGMVAPRSAGDRVRGELFKLRKPNLTLARLDNYEGCRPRVGSAEFARKRWAVRLDDGRRIEAWIYLYEGDLACASLIRSGDYLHGGPVRRRWPKPAAVRT